MLEGASAGRTVSSANWHAARTSPDLALAVWPGSRHCVGTSLSCAYGCRPARPRQAAPLTSPAFNCCQAPAQYGAGDEVAVPQLLTQPAPPPAHVLLRCSDASLPTVRLRRRLQLRAADRGHSRSSVGAAAAHCVRPHLPYRLPWPLMAWVLSFARFSRSTCATLPPQVPRRTLCRYCTAVVLRRSVLPPFAVAPSYPCVYAYALPPGPGRKSSLP